MGKMKIFCTHNVFWRKSSTDLSGLGFGDYSFNCMRWESRRDKTHVDSCVDRTAVTPAEIDRRQSRHCRHWRPRHSTRHSSTTSSLRHWYRVVIATAAYHVNQSINYTRPHTRTKFERSCKRIVACNQSRNQSINIIDELQQSTIYLNT